MFCQRTEEKGDGGRVKESGVLMVESTKRRRRRERFGGARP